MKHALPPLTQDRIEAYLASAILWLVWLARVITTLGAPRKSRRLHRFVERLEREVESILFLRALHRSRLSQAEASLRRSLVGEPPRRLRRPSSTPPGFRRQRRARLRQFFRSAGVRARKASLAQRIASLAAALANPEPHIAYFLRRLLRGLRGARLIAAAPPVAACADLAAPRGAFADSS